MQGLPLSPEETPQVKAVALPAMPCPTCGLLDTPRLGAGRGPHVGELRCQAGHHIKWAPKALLGLREERNMGGIARCTVVGCISKHGVEVRYATSGAACASLTLVVTEQGQDGRPHDLYVGIEVWGQRAEVVGELEPGQLCLFEGKLAKRKKGEQWELIGSGFDLTPIVAPVASMAGGSN
jgi:Single-strand binding protein family